jgi:acetoin utilization deacetylase AcuC-like enzyme
MPKAGLIYDPVYLKHDTGAHPENAGRLEAILQVLEEYGIRERLVKIDPVPAAKDQLALYHTPAYIDRIEAFGAKGGGHLDGDTVMSRDSYRAAVMAAGGVITAVDQVMQGKVDNAFALVRPPGHHAEKARAMGFCIFNNVAVAALYAKKQYGLKRILILDWDVHHGNGTQDAFAEDPQVLYFSTHQQGNFPGTGWVSDTGRGAGEGYTVNVPLAKGTGDSGFYYLFTRLFEPIARQFNPELVMISAGFDAHHADPLAGLELTVNGYSQMAEIVRQVVNDTCGGKVVMALEGGYALGTVGYAAAAVLNVFGDFGCKIDEPGMAPRNIMLPQSRISVDEAIKVQSRYWRL